MPGRLASALQFEASVGGDARAGSIDAEGEGNHRGIVRPQSRPRSREPAPAFSASAPTMIRKSVRSRLAAGFGQKRALADRIGGLRTILAGSFCQMVARVGFLAIQSEAGLFTVS